VVDVDADHVRRAVAQGLRGGPGAGETHARAAGLEDLAQEWGKERLPLDNDDMRGHRKQL
jgi:hypothetical protein